MPDIYAWFQPVGLELDSAQPFAIMAFVLDMLARSLVL